MDPQPFHSIIGDRGMGDGVDGSDGVVSYWSAHLYPNFFGPMFKKLTPVRGRPLVGGPRVPVRVNWTASLGINPPTYLDHGLRCTCDRCTRRKSAGP